MERKPEGTISSMSVPRTTNDLWSSFLEGSRFFMEQGPIFQTLRRLSARLDEAGIPWVLVGGMALVAHGYRRFTEDVDILLSPDGLAAFRNHLLGRGYVPRFAGAERTFTDTETGVRIEVLASGDFPGDGKPKPVAFPNPEDVRFERDGLWLIRLEPLIELKLASGLSAEHRLRDLADVQDLIRRLELPLDLADALHPSVADAYRGLWRSGRGAGSPEEPGR
jgi:hypothetical protein